MNLEIGDKNIIILTTPRTGSTALCRKLSDEFDLKYYNEAFHPKYDSSEEVWNSFHSGVRFICKIFPNHKITEQELDTLTKNSFVIFLERVNIVEQIASFHLLSQTEKPWYSKEEDRQVYTVDLDTTKVAYSIKQILALRQQAEKYRQLANIVLKYESIIDFIQNDHIRKYDHPTNYQDLILKIEQLLPIFTSEGEKQ